MSWQKVYYYLFTAAYLAWNIHFISGLRSEARLFTVVIATLFLVLYLLPPTIFGAKIEPVEQGVRVVQYGTAFIPYSEVRSCKSFFLFPVQAVVVTTKRRFPLNILIS